MVIRRHQNSKTQILCSMIIYSYATEAYLNTDKVRRRFLLCCTSLLPTNGIQTLTEFTWKLPYLPAHFLPKHKLLYKLYIYSLYNCIYLPCSKVAVFGGISLCSFAFLGVWVFSLVVRGWCAVILFSLKINRTCTPINRHLPSLKMITPFSSLPVLLVL